MILFLLNGFQPFLLFRIPWVKACFSLAVDRCGRERLVDTVFLGSFAGSLHVGNFFWRKKGFFSSSHNSRAHSWFAWEDWFCFLVWYFCCLTRGKVLRHLITNQHCEEFSHNSIWVVYKSSQIEECYPSEDAQSNMIAKRFKKRTVKF